MITENQRKGAFGKNAKKEYFMRSSYWIAVLFFIGAALMSGSSEMSWGKTFYVDQNAQEPGDGSLRKPFKSIKEAKDAVRNFKSKCSVQIVVSSGTYQLEEPLAFTTEDSGTKSNPVIYRASKIGQTVLSGGKVISPKSFRQVTDPADLKRIDSSVHGKVLCVDLDPLAIPKGRPLGTKMQMPINVPELFVDGKRMTLARWPNEGWATIKKIIDNGSKANSGSAFDASGGQEKKTKEQPRGGTFVYEGDRPAHWNVDDGVWLHGYWCFDWSSEVIKVAAIDKDKKEIRLAEQHTYGLRQGNPSPRRWIAVHLLEELDAPGEYYIDQKTNRLFFYPEKDLEKARIVLAYKNTPILDLKKVSDLTFKGFKLTETCGAGISAVDVKRIRIEKSIICNTQNVGLYFNDAQETVIHSCLIEQTGTGGIYIAGGDRKTLTPSHNVVENNVIRNFSCHRLCYANGLAMSGVGITALHNEFYGAPHQAIAMSTNDSVFEYNIVHHVCLTGDDCGALYKGRNPSLCGNIIRYNFWYDIGRPRGHGNAAIYFDDGDCGETVFGNIFLRTGEPGKGSFGAVFSHGGHGNLAENNIFIDCKRPLGSAPWNDKRWKDYIDAPLWQQRLLKDVDITGSVYTKHYPHLIGFMNGAPQEKRKNFAKRNLFINRTLEPSGNWTLDGSNWTTDHDPGFTDAKNNDFRLKLDAEVFKKIPGFQTIPFEKIGPYKD